MLSHKEISLDEQTLIVLLFGSLKSFRDMKNSIPRPEKQKRYLSQGSQSTQGTKKNQQCLIKTKTSLRSLRSPREDGVSVVCLMPVQNQNDNGKFMGQQ